RGEVVCVVLDTPPPPPPVGCGGVWWGEKHACSPGNTSAPTTCARTFWSTLGAARALFGPQWGLRAHFLVHTRSPPARLSGLRVRRQNGPPGQLRFALTPRLRPGQQERLRLLGGHAPAAQVAGGGEQLVVPVGAVRILARQELQGARAGIDA